MGYALEMTAPLAAPRGPYAKTAAQRRRILDVAAEEFTRHGFDGSSMSAIADGVGVNRAGVLHHFPTKEAVLRAVLEQADAIIDSFIRGREGVAAVHGILAILRDDSVMPRVIRLHAALSAEAIRADHPANSHFARRFLALATELERAFEQLEVEGRALTDTPPRVVARETLALAEGLHAQWLRNPEDIDVHDAVRRHVQRHFDVAL